MGILYDIEGALDFTSANDNVCFVESISLKFEMMASEQSIKAHPDAFL